MSVRWQVIEKSCRVNLSWKMTPTVDAPTRQPTNEDKKLSVIFFSSIHVAQVTPSGNDTRYLKIAGLHTFSRSGKSKCLQGWKKNYFSRWYRTIIVCLLFGRHDINGQSLCDPGKSRNRQVWTGIIFLLVSTSYSKQKLCIQVMSWS